MNGAYGLLIVNVIFGGPAWNYVLANWFGKDVPWYTDWFCGLLSGHFAIIVWVPTVLLKMCGVPMPLFG